MEIENRLEKSVVKPRKKLEQIPQDSSSKIPDNSHLILEENQKDMEERSGTQVPGTGNSPGKSRKRRRSLEKGEGGPGISFNILSTEQ